ncbi:DNA-dependent RNA polymerase 2 subunit Rpb6 [Bodo saltans virus]|uniref:DNA-dependent RNA polymerase 2 subunit Rpb6 n=1 Tax=Bodo saltans virus TaxID=2024608 RepID=A0A2H4UTV8_9VIRU|nr:DNA-dependent RNA polymerase 2 subunit Rpb6 [Bodo saltans virus]ATZ80380.1 DNA-dependent RNA polymerase 2 subunit Rpb6 [Bodo saltans virus]
MAPKKKIVVESSKIEKIKNNNKNELDEQNKLDQPETDSDSDSSSNSDSSLYSESGKDDDTKDNFNDEVDLEDVDNIDEGMGDDDIEKEEDDEDDDEDDDADEGKDDEDDKKSDDKKEDDNDNEHDTDDDCVYRPSKKKKNIDDDDDLTDDSEYIEDIEEQKSSYVKEDDKITTSKLIKYERVRALGDRAKNISEGAFVMLYKVGYTKEMISKLDAITIAKLEMEHKVCPIKIQRKMPSGAIEFFSINDLDIVN